jgi:alkylation response protein AidB-like acyl-CoA dehydrogenase
MGIKGSSTAQIYYTDVKVPVENMIGKRGEGFRIALSILHMGRLKLGANVLGAAKKAINDSVQYANERKQFGTHIANFGAIKFKLADQLIRTFAAESATYRVSKDIDDLMAKYKTEGCDVGRAAIDAIAHYAVEAALLKVYGSEMLDYVADEAVQIHGGMGYSAEMDVERGYRDSRINRIFEGTNEINRLLVVDTAMKRAMKGDFDMFGEAEKLAGDLSSLKAEKADGNDFFKQAISYIKNFKKIALLAINAASSEFGKKLVHEQEILFNISNIMMEIYVAESMALRVKKIEQVKGSAELYRDILDVYVYDASAKINKAAKDAFNSLAETDDIDKYLLKVDELSAVAPVNVKNARRRLADKLIEDNSYKF